MATSMADDESISDLIRDLQRGKTSTRRCTRKGGAVYEYVLTKYQLQ